MNYDINAPKLLEPLEIIKINENLIIKKGLYQKRGNTFYDVSIKLNDKEIFVGRYNKELNCLKINYKDGKILIYYDEFKKEERQIKIIKVLSLYDLLDDTFYSCTEEEALNIFDKNIDTSYLRDKKNYIYRSDIEKRKRL